MVFWFFVFFLTHTDPLEHTLTFTHTHTHTRRPQMAPEGNMPKQGWTDGCMKQLSLGVCGWLGVVGGSWMGCLAYNNLHNQCAARTMTDRQLVSVCVCVCACVCTE